MSRLMVFGACPLPMENTPKTFGPGIRAWQFIKPLLADGHEVFFAGFRIPFIYPADLPEQTFTEEFGFPLYSMEQTLFENPAHLGPLVRRIKPDALLAVTIFSSRGALGARDGQPLWIDLFGHVMAEAQAKSFRYENDAYLQHFWSYEYEAIRHGDVYSAVSTPQMYATIGELGALGRLNSHTTGYEFVHIIPCAAEGEAYTHDEQVMRGRLVGEKDFVILWSGGYNTWTDVPTLFNGLEHAMAADSRIHFVSTGGAIDGHDERTYPGFLQLIQESPHKDRYHMLGWLPKRQVHNYYFEADIGINIDKYMYEGMFGSKNRVMDWMRAGLPALVGELCELSWLLPLEGAGFSFPLDDAVALGEKILYLAAHPGEVRAAGAHCRELVAQKLNFEETTKPLRRWAGEPRRAPDAEQAAPLGMLAVTGGGAEEQLNRHRGHVRTLERYIRHLEREIRLRDGYSPRDYLRLMLRKLRSPAPPPVEPFPAVPPNPTVSVVVVTYNGASYIENCLAALYEQDYPEFEVIVVDNASKDGTADCVAATFPAIRLVRNRANVGFAAANNQGIALANGAVIALLNQDTVVQPGWLRAMVRSLVRDPTLGVVGCKLLHADGVTLQHAGGIMHANALTDHYGAGQPDDGAFDEPRDVQYVTGAAVAFRAELVRRLGDLDENYQPAYFEELDFCLRVRNGGYRVRYLPEARVIHFESTASGKFSDVFFHRYHRNRLRFVLKNFGLRSHMPGFIRAELRWLIRFLPPEQRRPLLRAYLDNVRMLPDTLRARLRERRRMHTRYERT
ncbi:glycosyltransferase [bacterium]|nr:glycosyltransferase [candidate division CSSED10-310 bacterium]